LIAELIGGEIARTLGLKVPEGVLARLDAAFGRTEPDEEIQDLLKASVGLNLGLHYLAGSITFDPAVTDVDPLTASRIVWLDALLTNVDRTARNTNMLVWNKELWLIDHGASLYFHHSWENDLHLSLEKAQQQAERPFTPIKDHVLLPHASRLDEAGAAGRDTLTPDVIDAIAGLLPDEWLTGPGWPPDESPDNIRSVYAKFLNSRIAASAIFTKAAQHARQALV
jgi:hypothetical protein